MQMTRRTTLRHWLKGFLPGRDMKSAGRKLGCRMTSAREFSETERRTIIEKVEQMGPWFHNYEIASGIWTNGSGRSPGVDYPLVRWNLIEGLLPNVRGKSCLDIGCSSGFFSLKLKELGADYVLGVDSGEQPQAIEQAKYGAHILGLDVDFRVLSAYDLATISRQFDVVLFMGVFYHLRHPLVALEAARSVCGGTMIFQTITTKHRKRFSELESAITRNVGLHASTMQEHQFPALRFVEGALDNDVSCWFVPNIQAVAAMLRSSGFQPDEMTFMNEQNIIVRCTVRSA